MTSILFPNNTRPRPPKLHVAAGTLQPFVDPKNPPTKRSPWQQVSETNFISSVSISLPSDFYKQICSRLQPSASCTKYAKVFMSLEEILTGEFFNTYIKIGNILMISEGDSGVDNIFTISKGVLRLDLGKEDYQRAGLQGTVSKTHGGRKHSKERFIVEFNLRLPSMVRGKNGYDRLLYAAKNVLNTSMVWLFRDLMPTLRDESSETNNEPIMKHHPTMVEVADAQVNETEYVAVPEIVSNPHTLTRAPHLEDREDYYELTEWLDLVAMDSPRIQRYDKPDPYISRYTAPGMSHGEPPPSRPISITSLKWTGLIDSEWIINLLVELIKWSRVVKSRQWLAMNVTGHRTQALGQIDGYTILLQPSVDSQLESEAQRKVVSSKPETQSNDNDTKSQENSSEAAILTGLQRFLCFQFVDS